MTYNESPLINKINMPDARAWFWFCWHSHKYLLNCGVGEESLLDCKEIKPVKPKGNQPWILIGRTGAEAEAPVLWPHDAKSWLTGKESDARKDWAQKKGMTEDEMVGWHHRLNGHESEQSLGDGEVQGSLARCSPRGHKELDVTEWLNNNKYLYISSVFSKQKLYVA